MARLGSSLSKSIIPPSTNIVFCIFMTATVLRIWHRRHLRVFLSPYIPYRDYGKAKNYLYCIAGNIIKNFYKKKKEVLLDEIPEMADNGMEGIELRMDVEQALESLPDELREAAILFFFQELKQKEIAELLDIKLSLVKYRISRAKKLLSERLEVKGR